jgi:hypothetical protein
MHEKLLYSTNSDLGMSEILEASLEPVGEANLWEMDTFGFGTNEAEP